MMTALINTSRRIRREGAVYVDRSLGDVALIAVHELGALSGHWSELRERAAVARRARSVGEMLQDQLDLFPETRTRLRHDQRLRRELWRGLANNLTLAKAA